MKKLLILAIALTFCLLIYVCVYYMLSAARVPVLTFSPSNEIEVCTLDLLRDSIGGSKGHIAPLQATAPPEIGA